MKWMKLAVVFASVTAFGRAYAFHEGGVAYCDGCHTMHNSNGNKAMAKKGTSTQFQGLNYLLQGSDDSSTCLNCHAAADAQGAPASYHIMTYPAPTGASGLGPVERTPGGDFAWLTMTFTPAPLYGRTGNGSVVAPERHGHNIVAADYGLVADATLTSAPGGTYKATDLSCASCHDPHSRARVVDAAGTVATSAFGKQVLPIGSSGSYGAVPTTSEAVGVYRLLGSAAYTQMSVTGMTAFASNPPVAVAPATYNRTESTTDTRVAYGTGMSEWCANCHVSIHNDNVNAANTALIHPSGSAALLSATANDLAGNANGTTIAAIYNAYKSSGDLTGAQATSYTSLVPYEEGIKDLATLASHAVNDGSITTGPSTGKENVMCLSCHRAHASGWSSMTRWNNKAEFLTLAGVYPGIDATDPEAKGGQYNLGMTQAQVTAAMYDRPATKFAYAQRSLCNKCHAKD